MAPLHPGSVGWWRLKTISANPSIAAPGDRRRDWRVAMTASVNTL
jgi:hypothetical protein